jgi:hypothetical protein
MQELTVKVTATGVHQKALSACHGAPLDRVTPGVDEFTCRECGEPTERVYGAPTVVEAHG